jgi:hypothetical protein
MGKKENISLKMSMTESIVCHTDSINYEIGFLYIIIYFVNI